MKPREETSTYQLADHLFRHESGKMISVITGMHGPQSLQLAEDVVQESLVRALNTWPYRGIPGPTGASPRIPQPG